MFISSDSDEPCGRLRSQLRGAKAFGARQQNGTPPINYGEKGMTAKKGHAKRGQ